MHAAAPMRAEARVFPPPDDPQRFDWGGGVFATARRRLTASVEGVLAPSAPLLMVTLEGGAEHHESETDDGHRHAAPDVVGSVSFLPKGCVRRLRLRNVAWRWASLTLPEAAIAELEAVAPPRPFHAARDPLVLGVLAEMTRLHEADRGLDASYCDAMSLALVHHLAQRHWRARPVADAKPESLPAWRLRRVADFVEAHLADELRIAMLAEQVGLSAGHFQRAFRASTGRTALQYITARRIEAAKRLLATGDGPVGEIAAQVGFVSPSHLARVFRASTGASPQAYRRAVAAAVSPASPRSRPSTFCT